MPTRLLFDLGGMVQPDGTAMMGGGAGHGQPTTSYVQAKLTAALSEGTGNWQVEVTRALGATGTLVASTQGAGIETSFILGPGEMIHASVSGATPGAFIRGSVMGTQAHPAADLPPLYHGGSVTVQQAAPPTPAVAILTEPGQHVVVDSTQEVSNTLVVSYHLEPD